MPGDYDLIFDDDGSGEAADVVAIRDAGDWIEIEFYHCKYSTGDEPARGLMICMLCAGRPRRAFAGKRIWIASSTTCKGVTLREKGGRRQVDLKKATLISWPN